MVQILINQQTIKESALQTRKKSGADPTQPYPWMDLSHVQLLRRLAGVKL